MLHPDTQHLHADQFVSARRARQRWNECKSPHLTGPSLTDL
jgi:hypothetical protein